MTVMGSRRACQTGVGCRLQEAWVLLAGENPALRPRGQTLKSPVSHVPQCDVKVALPRHGELLPHGGPVRKMKGDVWPLPR